MVCAEKSVANDKQHQVTNANRRVVLNNAVRNGPLRRRFRAGSFARDSSSGTLRSCEWSESENRTSANGKADKRVPPEAGVGYESAAELEGVVAGRFSEDAAVEE
jgi:hypothetical protein